MADSEEASPHGERPLVTPDNSPGGFEVVAIAASAGGLTALATLLTDLSSNFPAALLVVQHLDPHRRSLLVEILRRKISLPVQEVKGGELPLPGNVYVAPPDYHLLVGTEGHLVLSQTEAVNFLRPSANLLFTSAAACFGARTLAVVLTGSGTDGMEGIQAIKATGGTVLVQTPNSAEFTGMPSAALKTGLVDWAVPLEDMADTITALVLGHPLPPSVTSPVPPTPVIQQHSRQQPSGNTPALPDHRDQKRGAVSQGPAWDAEDQQALTDLLQYLKRARNIDLTGYKTSNLQRRIAKRLRALDISRVRDYQIYLKSQPEEFVTLLNTVLINVTTFFRDPTAWRYLQHQILPQLLAQSDLPEPSETPVHGEQEPSSLNLPSPRFKSAKSRTPKSSLLRVWSAGCSSGAEPYTLAIILAEILGQEQITDRVKIYATDIDDEALAQARAALYSLEDLQTVPAELRDKYFERVGHQYSICHELRRIIVFGRHDLLQDAPISHLDLLICRNTLMYFNAEAQRRILQRFHFALNPKGILFLGSAEMLLTHNQLFVPIDLPNHVFTKVSDNVVSDHWLSPSFGLGKVPQRSGSESLFRMAMNALPLGVIILDPEERLQHINPVAEEWLGLQSNCLGKQFRDLDAAHRLIDLRPSLDQLVKTHQSLVLPRVTRHLPDGQQQSLEIILMPLMSLTLNTLQGISITLMDVSRYVALSQQLLHARQDFETMHEELQSGNEELETTNEELQSANEELETTNEELQASNEELETMNEELQSANEELQDVNRELRLRTTDLNQANAFLNSILTSLPASVIVVNEQLTVIGWNPAATELWGLRSEEVEGVPLIRLNIGLPLDPLQQPLRDCLNGQQLHHSLPLQTLNRQGQLVHCQVTLNALIGSEAEPQGVILLIDIVDQPAQA